LSASTLVIWVVIGATSALAFASRAVCIVWPESVRRLPGALVRMLESIGPAALAALVMPALLPGGSVTMAAWPDAVGLAVAAAAALRWRRSALTIGAGIAVICLLQYGLGQG
jgi:branched-subunit amino acid transport protein